MQMATKKLLQEALQRAIDSYTQELSEIDQRRKELKEKISALEKELGINSPNQVKRGRKVPYTSSDFKELYDKLSTTNFEHKDLLEAARIVYRTMGKPLHAGLVFQFLVSKGIDVKSKNRPKDVFASYLRRSKDFEKAGIGMFRIKQGLKAVNE
jgi:hypothetical protein